MLQDDNDDEMSNAASWSPWMSTASSTSTMLRQRRQLEDNNSKLDYIDSNSKLDYIDNNSKLDYSHMSYESGPDTTLRQSPSNANKSSKFSLGHDSGAGIPNTFGIQMVRVCSVF